jgi:hypothetical protein
MTLNNTQLINNQYVNIIIALQRSYDLLFNLL